MVLSLPGDVRALHCSFQGLLQRKVEQRLGSGRGDAEELKVTSFFDGLDWEMVYFPGGVDFECGIYIIYPVYIFWERGCGGGWSFASVHSHLSRPTLKLGFRY